MNSGQGRHRKRWFCYMGPWAVPQWLFDRSPMWLHHFAYKFGGVQ
jgi:hypothetical protein